MLTQVARGWRVYAVRGVAAIILGMAALVWPGPTLAVLVYLFGAFAFVDGVAMLAALARGDILARRHAWATGLSGVAGIVIAIATLVWPGITALTLLYLVAFWAILTGVLQIVAAIELRRVIEGEFWMILGGALSIVFGSLLMVNPGTGLLSLVWLVGFYAIMFGCSSLGVAYRLHRINRDLENAVNVTQSAGVA
jgi:uncharacterized membrane protein HdeD (DUF308 family)